MMQSNNRHSITVADVKLIDVVRLSRGSLLLRSRITQAHKRSELPVDTIGAYLAGYPATERQFRSLRWFGRKSVRKLTTLLRKWDETAHAASDLDEFARCLGLPKLSVPELREIGVLMTLGDDLRSIAVVEADTDSGSAEDSSDVLEVCLRDERGSISVTEVKILDVVSLSQVSVRLRNWVTRANKLPVDTIGAYWAEYPETEGQFLKIRNLGRKSVRELTNLLKKWNDVAHVATNPIEFTRLLGIHELSTADQLQEIGVIFYRSAASATADILAERQSTIAKERPRVERDSISVAEVKILDAVRLSQVSVRLRNGINQAQKLNNLPAIPGEP